MISPPFPTITLSFVLRRRFTGIFTSYFDVGHEITLGE